METQYLVLLNAVLKALHERHVMEMFIHFLMQTSRMIWTTASLS